MTIKNDNVYSSIKSVFVGVITLTVPILLHNTHITTSYVSSAMCEDKNKHNVNLEQMIKPKLL